LIIGTTSAGRNILAAVVAMAFMAAASGAPAQSGGHEYTAIINNMDYGSTPANLKVGDTIVWVNRDTVQHSVTARDHSFDIRLNPGQSAKLVLSKAGKIPFICSFHPTMRGTLNVAAK
jgi:plastocyanin